MNSDEHHPAMTHVSPTPCADFERQLPDYQAGRLSDADARHVEAHAASCETCEPRLDAITRRAFEFAPPLPPTLRDQTLQAVQTRRSFTVERGTGVPRRQPRRWGAIGGLAGLAAAAALAVFVINRGTGLPGFTRLADSGAADSPIADTPATTTARIEDVGMMQSAAQFAESQARSEFVELDAAAREIEAALAATPTDRELRTFLSTVRARRDELSRRVKEATL
jgi:Putative zinc-finger